MIKVTYIISDIEKAKAFEWVADYIDKKRIALSFILINPGPSDLEHRLSARGLVVHRINCNSKKDWPPAFVKIFGCLRRLKPHIIHCHLIQANILGLTAGKLAGIKKRIYTRHHSSFHHVYFPKGVWWDKYSNRMATHIVAISGIVKQILEEWEGVSASKVSLIPHGFLLDEFVNVESKRVEAIKQKYHLEGSFTVGVASRFTELKGIQFIIPAFEKFLNIQPNAVLLLFNPKGDYEAQIKNLLKKIPEANYRLIPFESDMAAAYKGMNVFVHVPIDEHSEAFGQTYVEALAASTPSIFTLSGIATNFIKHGINALVVPYKDSESIFMQLKKLNSEQDLIHRITTQGVKDVTTLFPLKKMIRALEDLYAKD